MTRKTVPAAFAYALAATLVVGPLAYAQAPQQSVPNAQTAPSAAPAHTPDPHRQAMRIAKQLSLTPDQTAKLEPILADRDQKIADLRTNTALAPRDARKQMHAIQQRTRSQLSSVLTADQVTQLDSMRHAHTHPGQGQALPATAPPA